MLEAGPEGVQLNGREAVGEAAEDARHAGEQRLKESDESGVFSSVLKGYLEERTAVVWGVGWRLGEGPRLDVTMGFHRAPGRMRLPSGVGRNLPRLDGVVLRARYEMQLPVLIDVVEDVQPVEGISRHLPAVVPSYVWLKVADRSPLAPTEVPDPLVAPVLPFLRGVEDREHDRLFEVQLGRELAAISAEVEFVGEVVERGAQVEHDLPGPERPVGIDAGQLAHIEAVLKSAPVFFGPNGPSLTWRPDRFDLTLEFPELTVSAREFGEWPFEAR